jgi:1,4-alpha-glucan branching enzyme
MEATKPARRLPVGAEALPGGGVHFRVWAPRRRRVEVVFEGESLLRRGPRLHEDAEFNRS